MFGLFECVCVCVWCLCLHARTQMRECTIHSPQTPRCRSAMRSSVFLNFQKWETVRKQPQTDTKPTKTKYKRDQTHWTIRITACWNHGTSFRLAQASYRHLPHCASEPELPIPNHTEFRLVIISNSVPLCCFHFFYIFNKRYALEWRSFLINSI